MNSGTTGGLSQPIARWKCNVSKDADYPHQDGKTPEASLQLGIGLRVLLRSVVGRIWSVTLGWCGSDDETPICKICNSNTSTPPCSRRLECKVKKSKWKIVESRKAGRHSNILHFEIYFLHLEHPNAERCARRQCLVGSLSGALASQKVTEAYIKVG